ncbi:TRAP transporter large permease [Aestuariivita sp.]|jgi:tripartite ATP-independent transporter DctM subunit|uniref:TRAP transporter large permease n=1 Tax=Aestuariivita sp. TaxID=1872407 RepID=UPI00216C88C3|nr:TRAP transporter large permease [Aestuariivita sp.]MCE8005652.1 TRAP transporter large permease [Aestuariivita sp.]
MGGFEQGGVAFVILLVLLAIGVPVGFALAGVAAAGLYFSVGPSFLLTTFKTTPYTLASDYTFVVVPMFVLMGAIAGRAGIIGDLYAAAQAMLSRVRGSLFMATIVAQAGFAAASGSTVVASGVFTRMALPEMLRFRYDPGVSAGCIAAAGTLAGLIPPSIAMVLFALLTGQPVGALLIAGILPGVLTAAGYMVGIRIFLQFRPHWAPDLTEQPTWPDRFRALSKVWSVLLLMTLVMGGIYSGLFPPSAAGAVGAAGALLIALSMRRLAGSDLWEALLESARITAMIFLIVIAGLIFSRFLLISGFIGDLRSLVQAAELGVTGFLVMTVILFLLLGMFLDSVSLLVITMPFLFPISQTLGINPIWFAVIVVKLIEIAAISPPVGLNLYAVLASADGRVRTGQLFRGVTPFLMIEMVILGLLLAFPVIATFLPDTMG